MGIKAFGAALTACLGVTVLAGCDAAPTQPGEASFSYAGGATATGGGHFDAGVDVKFSFGAAQRDDSGTAVGQLRFETALGGLAIEFHGRVTCLAVDAVNNRAWIGGVVTRNGSEHPAFQGEIHQVGRDIWFRVVDYGEGGNAAQADRTTFVGFEGAAGIITSEEYCEARIWPGPDSDPPEPQDARTGPVTQGNILVRG